MKIRYPIGVVVFALASVAPQVSAQTLDLVFNDGFDGTYNFRIDSLSLHDPHVFFNFLGCDDVTDTSVTGFSIDGAIQNDIQNDNDGDGLLDVSYVLRMKPLDQTDGASSAIEIVNADCFAPESTAVCKANSSVPASTSYVSSTATTCLSSLPGTTHGYVPSVTSSVAPCFSTSTTTLAVNLAGLPVTLHDVRIGATYSATPATSLINGLIAGFISEADANSTFWPMSVPIVGGQALSSVLAGGTGACPAYSDKDLGAGSVVGWWLYWNYSANRVAYYGY